MTTKRWLLIAALAFGVVACQTGRSTMRGGLSKEQLATYPQNVQDSYKIFAARCSRCHTLSRPLAASITAHAHWESYVNRMRRHAGSGISKKDGEKILVFLYHYADQKAAEQAGEEPPPPPPADPPPPPAEPPATKGAAQ